MASQGDDTHNTTPAETGAAEEQQQQQQQQQQKPPTSANDSAAKAAAAAARLHRPILQSLPEARPQSFDEIYGPPENFLEIEVRVSWNETKKKVEEIRVEWRG